MSYQTLKNVKNTLKDGESIVAREVRIVLLEGYDKGDNPPGRPLGVRETVLVESASVVTSENVQAAIRGAI